MTSLASRQRDYPKKWDYPSCHIVTVISLSKINAALYNCLPLVSAAPQKMRCLFTLQESKEKLVPFFKASKQDKLQWRLSEEIQCCSTLFQSRDQESSKKHSIPGITT